MPKVSTAVAQVDAADLLYAWLKTQGKTAQDFAAELGMGPEMLSRYMRRRAQPSKVAALAIEFLTGGTVPHTRWGPLVTKKKDEPRP